MSDSNAWIEVHITYRQRFFQYIPNRLLRKLIYEKCECFNKKFKIDLKTTECKYREFNDEKDVEMWADNLYKDWSERIKEFRLNLYIYKIFPCDWHNHLNSDTTAIEMYCGYPYKQMNMILRKLYNERITIAHIKSWRILHTPYRRPLETFEQTITVALALYSFKTTP